MTQRLPTALARKDFANVLRDSAAGERIKLTRYNKTVAVIIPTKDLPIWRTAKNFGGGASSEQPERKASQSPRPQGSQREVS